MLVDLHRNDIGRVMLQNPGTVVVSDCMTAPKPQHSHVMRTSRPMSMPEFWKMTKPRSDAAARQPAGWQQSAYALLKNPHDMQIIDELEPTRRGPYGGAVGYLDFAGNLDTCIALRTIVWKNGIFDIQVGAGVVADSVPAMEYEETMNKAKAMLKAVEIAEKVGFKATF